MNFDVFNGDADGLCALHQLRLADPVEARLITGVKRDIGLLKQVEAKPGDQLTVLDIAVEKNADALADLLAKGVRVRWFDHHNPGPSFAQLTAQGNFEAHIDTDANVCTSLLVDQDLNGRHRPWAVVAAFGDNLHDAAWRAAEGLGLDDGGMAALRELGECLNYNGYGDSLADLHFHPAELYRRLHVYADPFDFIAASDTFPVLKAGYAADMAQAGAVPAHVERPSGAVFLLPDEPWARRVSGVYANDLATRFPDRAHAMLSHSPRGHYVVSVRAPLNNRVGADTLCMKFPTGGGRKAAAGINALPAESLDAFMTAFYEIYAG